MRWFSNLQNRIQLLHGVVKEEENAKRANVVFCFHRHAKCIVEKSCEMKLGERTHQIKYRFVIVLCIFQITKYLL